MKNKTWAKSYKKNFGAYLSTYVALSFQVNGVRRSNEHIKILEDLALFSYQI
jgi:hypothetical protein